MVIVTQVSYPATSMREVAKRFLQAPQLPEYLKRTGPFVNSDINEGIQVLTIYECDPQRLGDGINALATYMSGFYDVPGFSYSNRVWHKVGESLKNLGLSH